MTSSLPFDARLNWLRDRWPTRLNVRIHWCWADERETLRRIAVLRGVFGVHEYVQAQQARAVGFAGEPVTAAWRAHMARLADDVLQ